MYRSYFFGLVLVTAVVAALSGVLGRQDLDEVSVLSVRIPDPVSSTSFEPALTQEPITVPFVEHDDDPNHLRTTTTTTIATTTSTTTSTTTTVAPTTTAESEAAATTQAKKSAPPAPAVTGGFNSGYESGFASSINGYRSSQGLPGLTRDGSLDGEARAWAKRMGEQGGLSHSNLGRFLPPWSAAAENVGAGGSVSGLFDALVSSSGHRANMLGNYTHFGVGVWVDGSGTMWTCHVFAG
jgi:uncharacterized protein YkwD